MSNEHSLYILQRRPRVRKIAAGLGVYTIYCAAMCFRKIAAAEPLDRDRNLGAEGKNSLGARGNLSKHEYLFSLAASSSAVDEEKYYCCSGSASAL